MYRNYRNINVANLRTCAKCHERPVFFTEEDLARHDDKYHKDVCVEQELYKQQTELSDLKSHLNWLTEIVLKNQNQNKEKETEVEFMNKIHEIVESKNELEDEYDDIDRKLRYLKQNEKTRTRSIELREEELQIIKADINYKTKMIYQLVAERSQSEEINKNSERRSKDRDWKHTKNGLVPLNGMEYVNEDSEKNDFKYQRQTRLIMKELNEKIEMISKYEDDISNLKLQLTAKERELKNVEVLTIEKDRIISEMRRKEKELPVDNEEIDKLKQKLVKAKAKLAHQQRQLENTSNANKGDLEDTESELREIKAVCLSLRTELKTLKKVSRKKLNELNKNLIEKSDENKEAEENLYKLQQEIDLRESASLQMQTESGNKLNEATEELNACKMENESLAVAVADTKRERNKLLESNNALKEQVDELSTALGDSKGERKKLLAVEEKLIETTDQLKASKIENESLAATVADTKKERKKFLESNNTLKERVGELSTALGDSKEERNKLLEFTKFEQKFIETSEKLKASKMENENLAAAVADTRKERNKLLESNNTLKERVGELSTALGDSKEERNKLLEFTKFEQKFIETSEQLKASKIENESLAATVADTRKERNKLLESNNALKERIDELSTALGDSKEERNKFLEFTKFEQKFIETSEQLKASKIENESLAATVADTRKERNKLLESNDALKERNAELSAALGDMKKKLIHSSEELENTTQKLDSASQAEKQTIEHVKRLENEKNGIHCENEKLHEQWNTLRKELESELSQKGELIQKNEIVNSNLETALNKNKQLHEQNIDVNAELDRVKNEKIALRNELETLKSDKEDSNAQVTQLNMQLSTLDIEFSQLKESHRNCRIRIKNIELEKTSAVVTMKEEIKVLNEDLEKTKNLEKLRRNAVDTEFEINRKLKQQVETLNKKLSKAVNKEDGKDRCNSKDCESKLEEYNKEISNLKAVLKEKSEFYQLQEKEFRMKEEKFERDRKTEISDEKVAIANKDEKITLMEEQLLKLNNEAEVNKKLYESTITTLKADVQSLLNNNDVLCDELERMQTERSEREDEGEVVYDESFESDHDGDEETNDKSEQLEIEEEIIEESVDDESLSCDRDENGFITYCGNKADKKQSSDLPPICCSRDTFPTLTESSENSVVKKISEHDVSSSKTSFETLSADAVTPLDEHDNCFIPAKDWGTKHRSTLTTTSSSKDIFKEVPSTLDEDDDDDFIPTRDWGEKHLASLATKSSDKDIYKEVPSSLKTGSLLGKLPPLKGVGLKKSFSDLPPLRGGLKNVTTHDRQKDKSERGTSHLGDLPPLQPMSFKPSFDKIPAFEDADDASGNNSDDEIDILLNGLDEFDTIHKVNETKGKPNRSGLLGSLKNQKQ